MCFQICGSTLWALNTETRGSLGMLAKKITFLPFGMLTRISVMYLEFCHPYFISYISLL